MFQTSSITTQGQVTLPAKVRKFFGLKPGDKVSFFKEGNEIIVRPTKTFLDLKGTIKVKKHYTDKEMDKSVLDLVKKDYEE